MADDTPGSTSPSGAPTSGSDRRDKRRVKMSQPIRVRFSRPGWVGFDEVLATLNVSRNGLYFVTELDKYAKGMQLQVTYPYSEMPGALNLENTGEVVRVDRLPNGRTGVAVHLQVPQPKPKRP